MIKGVSYISGPASSPLPHCPDLQQWAPVYLISLDLPFTLLISFLFPSTDYECYNRSDCPIIFPSPLIMSFQAIPFFTHANTELKVTKQPP